MNHSTSTKVTLLRGGSLAAGVLAGTSAHAQLLVQNPNATVVTPDTLYFDVDQAPVSTTDSTLEAYLTTQSSVFPVPKVGQQSSDIEFTAPLAAGSVVDSNVAFGPSSKIGDGTLQYSGTDYYGFRLGADPTPNFGYVEITQVSATDSMTSVTTDTDTLNTIVYQQTAGTAVTVAPEPGTTSLLLAAAAGVAGLAAWRRRTLLQA